MTNTTQDACIIIENGTFTNNPDKSLSVFNLDSLAEGDIAVIQEIYERFITFLLDQYPDTSVTLKPHDLPPALRDALYKIEAAVIENTHADRDLIALARNDQQILFEIFDDTVNGGYGEQTAQHLARLTLGSIGIEVSPAQTVILTDLDPKPGTAQINSSQLQYAVEQYNLSTGESLDAEALESALDWLE